jgi:hypothetical protein
VRKLYGEGEQDHEPDRRPGLPFAP